MMKISPLVSCLCITSFVTVTAQGDRIPNDHGTNTAVDCDLTGYESYEMEGSWTAPACRTEGLRFGPLSIPDDGETITDLIFTMTIEHTWIGDVMIELQYDVNLDGTTDALAHPLCRHSLDGCPLDGCCGCSGDLEGDYAFQDGKPSIEDVCPSTFEPGCYGPDPDGNPLSTFSGLPKGGEFYFWFVDGGCGDIGTITRVGIHTMSEDGGTPVDRESWSAIKSRY